MQYFKNHNQYHKIYEEKIPDFKWPDPTGSYSKHRSHMHVGVGAVGEGREDGQRVELGIQPFFLWKEVSQDFDT